MGALPLPLHKFVRALCVDTREKSTKETSEDSWTGVLAYRARALAAPTSGRRRHHRHHHRACG